MRTDTDVPVFVVLTETEAPQNAAVARDDSDLTARGRWPARATSTPRSPPRSWTGPTATSRTSTSTPLECAQPNDFPTRYALRAAVRALAAWVEDGTAPPTAPARSSATAIGGPPPRRRRQRHRRRAPPGDRGAHRHLLGRIRANGYCGLTGSTIPFPTEELAERYPDPEAFAAEVTAAADAAVDAGHLLPEDAAEIVATATDALQTATIDAVTAEEQAGGTVGLPGSRVGASAPSAGAQAGVDEAGPAAPAAQQDVEDRGWMATTGRDLITPMLIALLLLINGRVVLTIANQRRRRR